MSSVKGGSLVLVVVGFGLSTIVLSALSKLEGPELHEAPTAMARIDKHHHRRYLLFVATLELPYTHKIRIRSRNLLTATDAYSIEFQKAKPDPL